MAYTYRFGLSSLHLGVLVSSIKVYDSFGDNKYSAVISLYYACIFVVAEYQKRSRKL